MRAVWLHGIRDLRFEDVASSYKRHLSCQVAGLKTIIRCGGA